MKQCNAIAKKTNAQCKNRALPWTNYCIRHYLKKRAWSMMILVSGSLVGITLAVIFSHPLTLALSRCRLFYYLDTHEPIVESIVPNINSIDNVHKDTKIFKVLYSDIGSGLDLSKSNIKIRYKVNQKYEPLIGKENDTDSALNFIVKKELQYGEYLFEVSLVDKANNEVTFSKPFIVREDKDIEVGVIRYKYEDFSKKRIFTAFFKKRKKLVKRYDFYVYLFQVRNESTKAILRDLYLTIDAQLVIFVWEEISNINVEGVKSYVLAETFDKSIPKERVYLSQRYLNIEKIAPRGFITFAVLLGGAKGLPSTEERPIHVGIFGTYISEGYGRSELRKLRLWVPIKEPKN